MSFAEIQMLPPQDLRGQGRDLFKSLAERFPTPFIIAGGCRNALRALPKMVGFLPRAPQGPWTLDKVTEEANTLEIGYQADEGWVEFYLGFLEAMIDHFGECAFILVKTFRHELRFQVTFAPA